MSIIKPVNGKHPEIAHDCFIAENATIVGEVRIGKQCSVWFNAVIRGDVHFIKIGDKVNLENSIKYGQKISGHICQGHVDTVSKVLKIKKNVY